VQKSLQQNKNVPKKPEKKPSKGEENRKINAAAKITKDVKRNASSKKERKPNNEP
jgi:hypothetical protein